MILVVSILNLLFDHKYSVSHITWPPRSWGWFLTVKKGGGAIATISNTGLGTHGSDDMDNNSIPDYLEILDGWLELRFLEIHGIEDRDILGWCSAGLGGNTQYQHLEFSD